MICHHCKKALEGNFVTISYGGLELIAPEHSVMSDKVESFLYVASHTADHSIMANVDFQELMQEDHKSQAESYFCSKQCLIDWFMNALKDLPEPVIKG